MKRINLLQKLIRPTMNPARHVFVKGYRGKILFKEAADYIVYLALLKQYVRLQQSLDTNEPFSQAVEVHAYGLQPTTVQLLVHDNSDGIELTKLMRAIHISYSRYYAKKYPGSGVLFSDVYKSTLLDANRDEYAIVAALHGVNGNRWYQDSRLFYEKGRAVGWIKPLQPEFQAK